MNAARATALAWGAVLSCVVACTPAPPVGGPRALEGVGAVDVWVDAGHGGRDPGNLGADRDPRKQEKHLVLEVARAFDRALVRRGYRVLLVRDDDRFLTLGQRSRIANGEIPNADGRQARGRLFVSLHLNGSIPEVVGTESFWSRTKSHAATALDWRADRDAAEAVHAGLAQALDEIYPGCTSDRSVREGNFSVLRRSASPAVLVELGFVSNRCQQAAVAEPARRERMAEALATGVRYALAPESEARVEVHEPFELPARPPVENGRGPDVTSATVRDGFDEGFESGTFPPAGWTLASFGPDTLSRWRGLDDATIVAEGASAARADGQVRGADSWLVSPPVAIPPGEFSLRFRWAGNRRTTAAVLAECRVRRARGGPWERVWSLRQAVPGPEFAWRTARVDLAAFAGDTVRVAFRAAGGRGADFLLDDARLGATSSDTP